VLYGVEDAPNPALHFGSIMHNALDTLYTTGSLDQAIEVFADNFIESPDEKKRTLARGVEVLNGYVDTHGEFLRNGFDAVVCETPLRMELGTIVVASATWTVIYQGKIDKIFYESDSECFCLDHKTSTWAPEFLIDSYSISPQFFGYIYMLRHALNVPVYKLVVDLLVMWPKRNDFIWKNVYLDDDAEREWLANILQTAHTVLTYDAAGVWPMHAPHACSTWNRMCQYSDICNANVSQAQLLRDSLYKPADYDPENF